MIKLCHREKIVNPSFVTYSRNTPAGNYLMLLHYLTVSTLPALQMLPFVLAFLFLCQLLHRPTALCKPKTVLPSFSHLSIISLSPQCVSWYIYIVVKRLCQKIDNKSWDIMKASWYAANCTRNLDRRLVFSPHFTTQLYTTDCTYHHGQNKWNGKKNNLTI